MNELEDHIARIAQKLRQLLKQYELLQKELIQKKQELDTLQQLQETQTARIRELEQQVLILRSMKDLLSEAEKKDLEKRINQHLTEINKCIDLLSE